MGKFSVRMKTFLLLLAALSVTSGAEADSDRQTQTAPQLPQFLQQLPFFSQLQSLQQAFQQLQATIPPEIMTQLQQSLPPFLANLLSSQQPAGRTLDQFTTNIQQLQQQLQQLQSSLPPQVVQQIQQALPPFLANLLSGQQATGRAGDIEAVELTEEEENSISDFIRRCNNLFGFGGSSYGYSPYSLYNSPYYSNGGSYYPYGDSTNSQTPYSTNSQTPYITVQSPYSSYPYGTTGAFGSNGVIYGTNGQIIPTGRALGKDESGIDRKKHGKGKPWSWWNKNPNSYNNYQNYYPSYPSQNYFQNPYQYQYPNYNQFPAYNYGTIGSQGVIVPATGTTGVSTPPTTVIREEEQ